MSEGTPGPAPDDSGDPVAGRSALIEVSVAGPAEWSNTATAMMDVA